MTDGIGKFEMLELAKLLLLLLLLLLMLMLLVFEKLIFSVTMTRFLCVISLGLLGQLFLAVSVLVNEVFRLLLSFDVLKLVLLLELFKLSLL